MISRSRARERRVHLASEDRRLQKLLHKEREKLFAAEQRKKEANPEAHPYSGMYIKWFGLQGEGSRVVGFEHQLGCVVFP